MSISTLTESETISYEPSIICGDCGNFANAHHDNYPDPDTGDLNVKRPKWVCFRDQYEVGDRYASRIQSEDSNGFSFDTLDGIPLTSNSGPASIERTEHWDVEPEINDGYDQRYDDLDPNEHTITLAEYRQGQRVNISDRNGSAYVEGQDGFIIVEVFDPILTEKFAFKLLNFYKSNGKQRVGSIELNREGYVVTATCVKCKSYDPDYEPMVINLGSPMLTRGLMEQITLDVIRHGNNHAAKWFTSRDTFYKIHEQHCLLDEGCSSDGKAGCSNEVTELHVKQLMEHFNSKERVA